MIDQRKLDCFTGGDNEQQRQAFLERAKEFTTSECIGLPYTVNLQVGGIYFVTTNIDVGDGLFNGATGTLVAIENDTRCQQLNEVVAA